MNVIYWNHRMRAGLLINLFVICQGKMKMKLINCEINEDEISELLN